MAATTQPADRLLNRSEAADLLNVSRRTIGNLVADGRLRPVRLGRRVLFDPHDMRQLIESAKEQAAT